MRGALIFNTSVDDVPQKEHKAALPILNDLRLAWNLSHYGFLHPFSISVRQGLLAVTWQ